MSPVLSVGVGLFLIALIAFPLLVFPVLSLIHCIRNPDLSTQSKIGWGCLIFFTWVIGASIYGIVVSNRPFYRYMGIACVVMIVTAWIAKGPLEKYQAKLQAEKAAVPSSTPAPGTIPAK
jgi:hypothetical protein